MSAQKAKFKLLERLARLGFTYDEAAALRRIEMMLQRWAAAECGDGNDHGFWAIERDEATGKPFGVHHHYLHGRGKDYTTRHAIADREAGALRRLSAIVAGRNIREHGSANVPAAFGAVAPSFVIPYHQSDPRGCALYLLTLEQLGCADISSIYTRGLAVCA